MDGLPFVSRSTIEEYLNSAWGEHIRVELKKFKELKSITTDNDLLLSQHNILSEVLGVPIYFCHPYSSWEKGTIENLNKFIRKFIRKGSNIHTYSTATI